eukprot:4162219-Amphidinium_carterae.2
MGLLVWMLEECLGWMKGKKRETGRGGGMIMRTSFQTTSIQQLTHGYRYVFRFKPAAQNQQPTRFNVPCMNKSNHVAPRRAVAGGGENAREVGVEVYPAGEGPLQMTLLDDADVD